MPLYQLDRAQLHRSVVLALKQEGRSRRLGVALVLARHCQKRHARKAFGYGGDRSDLQLWV